MTSDPLESGSPLVVSPRSRDVSRAGLSPTVSPGSRRVGHRDRSVPGSPREQGRESQGVGHPSCAGGFVFSGPGTCRPSCLGSGGTRILVRRRPLCLSFLPLYPALLRFVPVSWGNVVPLRTGLAGRRSSVGSTRTGTLQASLPVVPPTADPVLSPMSQEGLVRSHRVPVAGRLQVSPR